MSRETAGVVDEPARNGDEHAELLSELDSHALAFAMDMVEASDADVFGFDDAADPDDADREVAAAYRVPEGVVNLEDVTDECPG